MTGLVVGLVVCQVLLLAIVVLLYVRLRDAERVTVKMAEGQKKAVPPFLAIEDEMAEAFEWGHFDGFDPNEPQPDYVLAQDGETIERVSDHHGSFTLGVDMTAEEFDPEDLTKGGSFSAPERALIAPDEMRRPGAVPRRMTITERARGHFSSRWSHNKSQGDDE